MFRLLVMLGIVLIVVFPAAAQEDNTLRDPAALAQQLLGYDGGLAIPDPFPVYAVGDTTPFWVSKVGEEKPTKINATVAAATEGLYIFVEDGIDYNPETLAPFAGRLDFIFSVLRITNNRGAIVAAPQSRMDMALFPLLEIPDADNDPHLYVLFARDLRDNRITIYNPNNSLPMQLAPEGYTNQHEMVIVNTSAFPGVVLEDPAYQNVLTRQFFNLLAFHNTPGQAPWLREALATYMLLQINEQEIGQNDLTAFMNAPDTSLMQITGGAAFGVGQLFLRYVQQRFGVDVFTELFSETGTGLAPLDRVLARHNITDLETGLPITAWDVFADFVMANALNGNIGDGRFQYPGLQMELSPATAVLRDQFDFQADELAVQQLGTAYVVMATSTPVDFRLIFSGPSLTQRLPIPGDPANHFYWSGNAVNANTSLTRAFDLTGVEEATLTFDAWYTLLDRWNYGYVQVSADGGVTWDVLPATHTTTENAYGLAYGAAFTRISNPEPPRPFPYLGVGLDTDGITIIEITEDSPLQGTDVQVGDVIAGFDEQVWGEQPSVVGYLANFNPGDTVNLYLQRGEEFFSQEVVLAIHPTRVFSQESLWLPQMVDLSAYAGQQVLVRFAYISVGETQDRGFAVDNIAIPEIGFSDDAEQGVPGWLLNGWQQMNNQVQQRYLVQYALLDSENPENARVVRLIGTRDTVTAGAWDLSLTPNQIILLAISGLNDDTDALARFSLAAQSEGTPAEATLESRGDGV